MSSACGVQIVRGPTLARRQPARTARSVATGARAPTPLRLTRPAVTLDAGARRRAAADSFMRSAASAEPSTTVKEEASTSEVDVPTVDTLSYSQQVRRHAARPAKVCQMEGTPWRCALQRGCILHSFHDAPAQLCTGALCICLLSPNNAHSQAIKIRCAPF